MGGRGCCGVVNNILNLTCGFMMISVSFWSFIGGRST